MSKPADQGIVRRLTPLADAAHALEPFLGNGGLLPKDAALIHDLCEVDEVTLDALVAMGVLTVVLVGRIPHLALATEPSISPDVDDTTALGSLTETDTTLFQLDVALDVAREKALMVRIVLVLELIGALLLLRWIGGWWIAGV